VRGFALSLCQMKSLKVLISIVLLSQSLVPAFAGATGLAMKSLTVTTAKWSVIAVNTSQGFGGAPLSLTWTVNSGTAYSYFSIINNGTMAVNQFSVSAIQTLVSGSGRPNDVSFTLCQNGIWDNVINTCSGSPLLIGNSADLTFALTNISLETSSELRLQALTKPNIKNQYLTEVSVSVSRNAVRNGIISNS
jgi:hypothetical protein